MNSKFIRFLTLFMVLVFQFSFAQEKVVTGVVSDDLGPIAGASVVVKGTKNYITTDFDGKYTIKADKGSVLEISYIGDKELVTVGAGSVYNVKLKSLQLKEVVITEGYDRTRTKATTSTASTTISSQTLENRPNASVLSSLQGTTPGLTILSGSGSPGSAKFDGLIRGASSVNGNTDPLVVIDGVPSTSNQFRNLNQNDIESITVLKDAAGTALYGNKGANGILQITTKNAKFNSGVKFTYDSVVGVNTLQDNNYNMSNAKQLLTIEKNYRSVDNTTVGANLTDQQIAEWGIDTDWKDVFFNQDLIQQHNLGVSFGGDNISSFTNLGYFEQGGLVPTTDFKRFSVRNNLQARSKDKKFTFESQISLGYSKRNQLVQEDGNVNNNGIQNPLLGSQSGLPYVVSSPYTTGRALYNAIGDKFDGNNDTWVLQDNLRANSILQRFTESTAILNLVGAYKLSNSFTVRNRTGFDFIESDGLTGRQPDNYLAIVSAVNIGAQFGGNETQSNSKAFTLTNIASLHFDKTFRENHKLNAGLFMEYQKSHFLSKSANINGLNPLNYAPGAGTGYVAFNPQTPNLYQRSIAASKFSGATLSYFGTLDYEYKSKYGFGGTIRRDGTYRFVDENKWGTFWSVSGRWNIDRESFMENSVFDLLKLRASYGINGNQNIVAANYGFPALLTARDLTRDLNTTGPGYDNITGTRVSQPGNPTLQWEEVAQANIGLDFSIFKRVLEGNLDVYRKVTSELFNSTNISAVNGQYTINSNNGELRNQGIELALRSNIIRNENLKVSVFANGSYNTTKVIDITPSNQIGVSNLLQTGNYLEEWNLIPYAGVSQATGNMLFYDINGNVTETPSVDRDRRATGKTIIPKYQGGFGFNVDYKGFYINSLFSFTYDAWKIDNQYIWANTPSFIGDSNLTADMLNAWTPTNTNTTVPSLTASNLAVYDYASDRFLYDSSFLRLKNVNIGYNFPSKVLKDLAMSSLRFYIQGENLLTWTKWKGFDPEALTALSVTNYPNPTSVTFGVNVGF
jgi:TonB-linked SusC/RagA family outer membrane protein